MNGQAEIIGLRGAECRQLDAELVEVERGDLLVEMLGQDVDLVLIFAVIGEELDLGQGRQPAGTDYSNLTRDGSLGARRQLWGGEAAVATT